jgi:hypothetical protein
MEQQPGRYYRHRIIHGGDDDSDQSFNTRRNVIDYPTFQQNRYIRTYEGRQRRTVSIFFKKFFHQ